MEGAGPGAMYWSPEPGLTDGVCEGFCAGATTVPGEGVRVGRPGSPGPSMPSAPFQ